MEKVVGVVRNGSNGGKTSHRKTIRTTYSLLPRFLTSQKAPLCTSLKFGALVLPPRLREFDDFLFRGTLFRVLPELVEINGLAFQELKT